MRVDNKNLRARNYDHISSIMNSSTESLCRICLRNGATIPIFVESENDSDSTIQSKIMYCLNLNEKLEDMPGYPRYICNTCQMTLNTVFDFIKRYKETCKILQERLPLVKQECTEFDIEIDFDHPEYTAENHEINPNKKEIKIEFDDGPNLLAKIKPLCKFKVNEKNKSKSGTHIEKKITPVKKKTIPIKKKTSLIEKKITPVKKKTITIKKKTSLTKKKTAKKSYKNINTVNKLNRIKSSLLEGEFVWNGENWCFTKHSDKEKASETLNNNPVVPAENEKDIIQDLPKPKRKSTAPVLCEACGETFPNLTKLRYHEDKEHKNLATCPKCNMTLASAYYLAKHIKRVHSDVRNFVCSNCGKAFAFEKDLNSHIKVVHKRLGIRVIKKVPCKICNKDFCNNNALRVHERAVHTGERPAVCTVCDARFYDEQYLRPHMRLHTGECPYKCPVCGRGYSQACNMKSHMRNHRISELDEDTLSKIKPSWHKFMKP